MECMPVYYFERGKDEFVKDFERENMARKAARMPRSILPKVQYRLQPSPQRCGTV